MSYYYDKLNTESIESLTLNCGIVLHSIRNHIQGFVQLENPEILSIDTFSGNLEGQCRQIRQIMQNRDDIKPTIIRCAKVIIFMKKIISENFFCVENNLNSSKIEILRDYFDYLTNSFDSIDQEVNRAIMNITNPIFNRKIEIDVNFKKSNVEYEIIKNKEEDFLNLINKIKFDSEKTLEEFKLNLSSYGFNLTNKSHELQDDVVKYLGGDKLIDFANKIIQLAGDIENQGRAVISESTMKKINDKKIINNCTAVNKSLSLIKENINLNKKLIFNVDELINKVDRIGSLTIELDKFLNKGYV